MGSWFAWGSAQPVYYSYGEGDVYYQNETVYVNNEPYCSSAEYYDQATTVAQAVPEYTEQQSQEMEWLPLGVFALNAQDSEDSNMAIQLAVNKEGTIAGTYYNEDTGSSRPLEGSVDRKTQRAAFKFADGKNKDIVFDTVVYNFTKAESDMLVHFGSEKTQIVNLIRLDPPEEENQGNTNK